MRKISLAERRAIIVEYGTTLKNTGQLAQEFALTKRQVADILRDGGVVRPMGRPLVLPFSGASADSQGMTIYKRVARQNGAVQRMGDMLRELRAAQTELGRTYLAGLITRDQRSSTKGRVRPTHNPARSRGN